jgi:hypothetical protein
MPGTIKRIGPLALTTVLTTNVYNNASALLYDIITHLEVANKTGTAATFSLFIGATGANAAGTEWFSAVSVAANSVYHWYGRKKLLSTDFIVGGAGTTLALVLQMESDQNVV